MKKKKKNGVKRGGKREEEADPLVSGTASHPPQRRLLFKPKPLGIHGFQSLWRTLPILCLLSTVNLLFIH